MSSLKYMRSISHYYLIFISILIVYVFLRITKQNKYNTYGVTAACAASPTVSFERPDREAIVTVLAGEAYVPGALVLAYTLEKYGAMKDRDCILFIPYDITISTNYLTILTQVGWNITYLKPIQTPGTVIKRYTHTLLKLYAWNMTQYNAIAIVDNDAMITGSIEEPFQRLRTHIDISLLAAYDPIEDKSKTNYKSKHSCFNSGVMFIRPNKQHFKEITCLSMDATYYDLRLPDQNLLNNYYYNQWIELPLTYNMVVNQLADKFMLNDGLYNDTRILHFASHPKPWDKTIKENRQFQLATASISIWRQHFANMVNKYGWKNTEIF